MIIVRGNLVQSESEAAFVVEKTTNGFTIRAAGNEEVPFEFDATKLEFFPDIAYVARNIWGSPVLFWQSEIGHTRDGYSSICLRKKVSMGGVNGGLQTSYAMFCVDDRGTSHILVYGDTLVVGDASDAIAIEPVAETGCDIFERMIPGIAEFMKHSRAKVEAIARFNAVDAISGLENQIDLLTSAVAVLMAEFPVEKRPAWWDSFVSVVETHSSNRLRGGEKAISNIEIEKSKAREVQNAFFAKLTNG